MAALRTIGHWRNEAHPEYPDPADFVDEAWDDDERDSVAQYLSTAHVPRGWMGFSPCRICGKNNGSADLTDGVYIWPEGLSHYVEAHSVKLPAEFIEHACKAVERYEVIEEEIGWWLGAMRTA